MDPGGEGGKHPYRVTPAQNTTSHAIPYELSGCRRSAGGFLSPVLASEELPAKRPRFTPCHLERAEHDCSKNDQQPIGHDEAGEADREDAETSEDRLDERYRIWELAIG
jgi:hypothetical protein